MTSRAPSQPLWPFIEDSSHGYVPGLRYLPKYAGLSDEEFKALTKWNAGGPLQGAYMEEGFREELWDVSGAVLEYCFPDSAFVVASYILSALIFPAVI